MKGGGRKWKEVEGGGVRWDRVATHFSACSIRRKVDLFRGL